MCTSVPQIADLLHLDQHVVRPDLREPARSSIQMPGSAFAFTSARIMLDIR
jgi:hypothetical protein